MKPASLFFGIAGALTMASVASSHPASSISAIASVSGSVLIAQTTAPYRPFTFKGYECTVNCEGHEAGYEWAEEKGIDDPDDCGGNSQSFIDGCRAYAEEQNGSVRSDEGADNDEDDDDATTTNVPSNSASLADASSSLCCACGAAERER
jgi:hypothetical protein